MRVRFEDVVFDLWTRRVLRNGVDVHLSTKAFELLTLLIERRPAAVSKADLHGHLWPETFVTEANLPALISEVRGAIGDDARSPKYIVTLHKFGYAFRGTVIAESATAKTLANCWLAGAGAPIPLVDGDNVLGRDPGLAAVLDSATVSRRHARINVEAGQVTIDDLGSKNGTFVNNEPIAAPRALSDGDQIRIGSFLFTFRSTQQGVTTLTDRL